MINKLNYIKSSKKIVGCCKNENKNREEQFSIITDHEGVPLRMYNSNGEKTWECVLNIYGDAYVSIGEQFDFPFRSKGQYQDEETGLHYSMNGYYHPKTGCWLLRNQSNLELLESFAILV